MKEYIPALNNGQEKFLEERKLWAAVVKLAIDDIRFGSTKRKKRSQEAIRNYNSAKAWFLREKDRNVGSFLWVCDLLKLNPTLTRNRILLET